MIAQNIYLNFLGINNLRGVINVFIKYFNYPPHWII